MISRFKDFIKISFIQNVGILGIGKFISIFLGAVASIILARLLGPELYGIYGLIFAFVGLVGIFMDWGSSYASLTLLAGNYSRKNKQEIKDILIYFIKVTLLAICTIGILGIILAPLLTELLYKNSQIGQWARIILLSIFLGIIYNLLVIVLQATQRIKQLTILESVEKFIHSLLPIVFVLMGWGLIGVIWGHFISAFIFLILAIFIYSFLAQKDKLLPNLRQIFSNFRKIKFGKYFNFGFLVAIDKNIGNFLFLLPIIFLGIFAVPQEVAYFKIAFAYITIPLVVLGPISRLLNVQLPKSKTYGLKVLKNHFYKTAFYSGLISISLVILFVILAPYLIKFFYGEEYIQSVQLVYYLAIFTALSGFGVGLGPFYRTVNRMKISIKVNICRILILILLVLVLVNFFDPLVAIILSLVIVIIIFLALHFYIIRGILKKLFRKGVYEK